MYFAGRSTGGNSIFRYQPHDLNETAPNVASDAYNTPYNLGGPAISYIARVDPLSAKVLEGTFLLTRTQSGKGNSLIVSELFVGTGGTVLAAVDASETIENDNSSTVDHQHFGSEGMGLAMLSSDLKQRQAWVLFSAQGGPSQSSSVGVSCGGDGLCAVVGRASGNMILKSPIHGTSGPKVVSNKASPALGGYLVMFKA